MVNELLELIRQAVGYTHKNVNCTVDHRCAKICSRTIWLLRMTSISRYRKCLDD